MLKYSRPTYAVNCRGRLWNRKLASDLALGGGFAGVTLVTLMSTVLMQVCSCPRPYLTSVHDDDLHVHRHRAVQEVWHPEPASTQKLWLPCPAPLPGSLSAWAVEHLDTSALARGALQVIRSRI